jgi:hypothetical protein
VLDDYLGSFLENRSIIKAGKRGVVTVFRWPLTKNDRETPFILIIFDACFGVG